MAKTKEIKYPKGKHCRRVRSESPYLGVMPFIMKEKNDATNMFIDEFDTYHVDRYLHKKRAEGMPGLGILHVFIAAYIRTASQYPGVNRFIRGQRLYTRNNVEYVMSVKRALKTTEEDSSIKVTFELTDTIEDVYRKLNAAIETVKTGGETATDKLAGLINVLPRPLLNLFVAIIKFLDYFGILPKAIENASPFHGSIIITDLGSFGIPPVYHHIYNFGTLPVFVGIGTKRRRYEVDKEGKVHDRRYISYTVVTDERICDGYYYGQCFKMIRNFLKFPEQLENPPEKVVEDIY